MFLIHCTFEWGAKSEEKNAYYTKSKGAVKTQIYAYATTISCYKHTKFHAIPLNRYGERPSKRYTVQGCV